MFFPAVEQSINFEELISRFNLIKRVDVHDTIVGSGIIPHVEIVITTFHRIRGFPKNFVTYF